MSYIGQQLPADVFSGFTIDKFTGDGTANKALTLSKAPFSETTVLVTIDGVVQEPTDDFTVSGTTLTLVGTAANGSEINVTHLSGTVPSTLASKVDLNGVSDTLILDADADTTISADTDDQIDFKAGGTDIMSLTATTATINDGTTITTDDNSDTLTLVSTDADADVGPNLNMYRNSASPADNDHGGEIAFNAKNDAGEIIKYGKIRLQTDDVSDGAETGRFDISTMFAGSEISRFMIKSDEIVVNQNGANIDFRIEGDSLDDAFFVNAGASNGGQVCIGRQAGEGQEAFSVEQAYSDWLQVNVHSVSSGNIYMFNNKFTGQAPDNNVSYFMNCQDNASGATVRFRIFSDGDVQNHDNSYGSTSDERIKQGIRDANSQWDDIKALKIRNYKRNDDVAQYGDKAWEQIGVIAQELEASGMDKLVKNEVLWDKDDPEVKSGDVTEGDVKEYKGVKYSVLYMKAIKALQEAMAKIETLEADVKTLKGE